MIKQVAYERVAAYFRTLVWLAIAVASLGVLAGLAIGNTSAQTVVWVVTGVLAVGTLAIALLESRRYQRAAESAGDSRDETDDQLGSDAEARQKAGLSRYQRFFGRLAVFGFVVAVSGFVGGAFISGPASAVVIAMVGFGGLLIAWMALVIRKRIHTGPRIH